MSDKKNHFLLITYHLSLITVFMLRILHDVKVDWLGLRKALLMFSIVLLLAGLASAIGRWATPGGTEPFNLGVDFKGGTLVTVDFKNPPTTDDIRNSLTGVGMGDAVIQPALD